MNRQRALKCIDEFQIGCTALADIVGVNPARVSDYVKRPQYVPLHIADQIEAAVERIVRVQQYYAPVRVDIRDTQNFEAALKIVEQRGPALPQPDISTALAEEPERTGNT